MIHDVNELSFHFPDDITPLERAECEGVRDAAVQLARTIVDCSPPSHTRDESLHAAVSAAHLAFTAITLKPGAAAPPAP